MKKPAKKPEEPRLRWSNEETRKVVEAVAPYRLQSPPLRIAEALLKAQEVLPAGRRRQEYKSFHVHPLVGAIEAAVQALIKQREMEQAVVTANDQVEAVQAAVQPINPINGTTLHLDLNGRGALDDLLDGFCQTVVTKIAEGLRTHLRLQLGAVIRHSTQVVQKATAQKRKITIVGLDKGQENLIEREFNDLFDLKFYKADTPSSQIEAGTKYADACLMWAKFVGHKVQNVLPKDKTILVHGGITEMKNVLEEIYVRA